MHRIYCLLNNIAEKYNIVKVGLNNITNNIYYKSLDFLSRLFRLSTLTVIIEIYFGFNSDPYWAKP